MQGAGRRLASSNLFAHLAVMPLRHGSICPLSLALALCLALAGACAKQTPATDADDVQSVKKSAPAEKSDSVEKPESDASVTLKPEEAAKLGVATTAATAVRYVPAKEGFGVVVSHDVIAQAAADVEAARAGARQSQAVLARMDRLAGTAGAESAEARENAARQAAIDTSALRLAEAKSSSFLGQQPPWAGKEQNRPWLAALADGRVKLLRVTFPLGALNGAAPRSLRVARLDADIAGDRWTAGKVWDAPADAGIPGRSFFALLQNTDVGEGERLLAWATSDPSGAGETGVLIPSAAVIAGDGRYWYYLQRQPGVFLRRALDIDRPMADGYFVKDNAVKAGDLIVTSAASLLLSRQSNPGADAD